MQEIRKKSEILLEIISSRTCFRFYKFTNDVTAIFLHYKHLT